MADTAAPLLETLIELCALLVELDRRADIANRERAALQEQNRELRELLRLGDDEVAASRWQHDEVEEETARLKAEARRLCDIADHADNLAMAADGPVPATYEVLGHEATCDWMHQAYKLMLDVICPLGVADEADVKWAREQARLARAVTDEGRQHG